MARTPIYTTGPQQTAFKLSSEFTAPLSDVLAAEAEQAWIFSPGPSAFRITELGAAQGRLEFRDPEGIRSLDPVNRRRAARDPSSRRVTGERLLPSGEREQLRVLPNEEAQRRITEAGVPLQVPATGVTDEALDILIERKQAEMKRQSVLSRAETDLLTGAARLGTALGVTLLDPVNVAASFIPVVGQVRYAKMLAETTGRIARAGVRARQGALGGAQGAVIVEPIVLSAANAEQADYDLTDSVLNIAFGTVAGGGLHVGAGVLGDALRGAARKRVEGAVARAMEDAEPQMREEILRGAVGQLAVGERIRVDNIARLIPVRAVQRKVLTPGQPEQIVTPDVDVLAREMDPRFFNQYDRLERQANTFRRWIEELNEPRNRQIQEAVAEYDAEIRRLEKRQQNEGARKRKVTQQKIDNIKAERDAVVEGLQRQDTPDMARVRRELMKTDERMRDLAPELTRRYQAAREAADSQTQTIPGEPPSYRLETIYEEGFGIKSAVENARTRPQSVAADYDAAQEVARMLDEATDSTAAVETARAEADEVKQELADLYQQLGERAPELREESELVQSIPDIRKGMEAALVCQTRGG